MDLASTGGSPNRHKIPDYEGWGKVNTKVNLKRNFLLSYSKELSK